MNNGNQQFEEIRAISWDGTPSFAMVGLYMQDRTGRFVLTRDARFQIPNDVIVMRRELPPQQPQQQPQQSVQPVAAPVIPVQAQQPSQQPQDFQQHQQAYRQANHDTRVVDSGSTVEESTDSKNLFVIEGNDSPAENTNSSKVAIQKSNIILDTKNVNSFSSDKKKNLKIINKEISNSLKHKNASNQFKK